MTRTTWVGKFSAITFDLFGTLVEFDETLLPRMNIDGELRASLLAAPFRRLAELVPGVSLADALVAYAEAVAKASWQLAVENDREAPAHLQFSRCLERVGIADEAIAWELARSLMEATIASARPTDSAVELLARLHDRGCPLGLVSNLPDARGGHALLSCLGLDRYFDVVIFSGEARWRKPNPRIFEMAVAALGGERSSVLHVGDELRADIWGAGSSRLSTVWVNPYGATFEGDYPPRLVVPSVAALAQSLLLA